MPRTKPPPGTTHGICPGCRTWQPLTPGGYVTAHRYVRMRGGVTSPNLRMPGDVIRCTAVGRDPLKHSCWVPTPVNMTAIVADAKWSCACGLHWRFRNHRWETYT